MDKYIKSAHTSKINYNLVKCIDEYLAFQHINSHSGWNYGLHARTYLEFTECPRLHNVKNGKEAIVKLKEVSDTWTSKYSPHETGILISSGIDSATVAKMLPKKSYAFYATYEERALDPELDIVKKYCEENELQLIIVNVSWKDYELNMDYLMRVKKLPIHPCEIPVYMCCKKAQELGVQVLFSGWGADTHFGGMDKLMSKEWSIDEFIQRFEYCSNLQLSNDYTHYYSFLNSDNKINVYDFLTYNYHVMTLRSFFYIPELCGLIHLPLWSYLGIEDLDLKRIQTEPKYIIQETFKLMYPNFSLTEKLPFTRPTDLYMEEHFDDYTYCENLKLHSQKIKNNIIKTTGQQKWMVYILNRFLLKIIRLE